MLPLRNRPAWHPSDLMRSGYQFHRFVHYRGPGKFPCSLDQARRVVRSRCERLCSVTVAGSCQIVSAPRNCVCRLVDSFHWPQVSIPVRVSGICACTACSLRRMQSISSTCCPTFIAGRPTRIGSHLSRSNAYRPVIQRSDGHDAATTP
jgi:hypothetical protein